MRSSLNMYSRALWYWLNASSPSNTSSQVRAPARLLANKSPMSAGHSMSAARRGQCGAARTAVGPEPLLRRRPPCGCVVGCRRGLGGRLCLRWWRWRRSGLSLHARCRRDRRSELAGRAEVDPTCTSVRRRRGRREASRSSTLAGGWRPRRRRLWGRHMGRHTKGGSSRQGNRRATRGGEWKRPRGRMIKCIGSFQNYLGSTCTT